MNRIEGDAESVGDGCSCSVTRVCVCVTCVGQCVLQVSGHASTATVCRADCGCVTVSTTARMAPMSPTHTLDVQVSTSHILLSTLTLCSFHLAASLSPLDN